MRILLDYRIPALSTVATNWLSISMNDRFSRWPLDVRQLSQVQTETVTASKHVRILGTLADLKGGDNSAMAS